MGTVFFLVILGIVFVLLLAFEIKINFKTKNYKYKIQYNGIIGSIVDDIPLFEFNREK